MVAPMQAGMIVSNEPAFYADGDFGIRVESHMVTVPARHAGFLKFETLSRLPIDPRLIDREMLSMSEKRWLADDHVKILEGYRRYLDEETSAWLQRIAGAFVSMAQ
jgi:Xaa-Pro aminopeptidase